MVQNKRKNSTELERSHNKDARTDAMDEHNGTSSTVSSYPETPITPNGPAKSPQCTSDQRHSTNDGSPNLADNRPTSHRQRLITEFPQQSQSSPSSVTSPLKQSTPSRLNAASTFEISSTHAALIDIASGDIFATPSAVPNNEFITIKAVDLETLLAATNNLQRQMVKITTQLNTQKDQLTNTLKHQEVIVKELTSLKSAPKPTENVSECTKCKALGKQTQTGQTHPVQTKNNSKPQRVQSKKNTDTRTSKVQEKPHNQAANHNTIEQHIDKYLPMWRKNHYYRRKEYKRHYHSKEKIKIIQEHISQKYIPSRYRPRQTHTKSEYNLEENYSYTRMKHEIEKFQFHSDTARGNFECTDQEMLERIDAIAMIDDSERDKMKELWLTEVSNAVEKAHELCEYNLIYLRNLPKKEPYLGYIGITSTQNTQSRNNGSSSNHSNQHYRNNQRHSSRGFW